MDNMSLIVNGTTDTLIDTLNHIGGNPPSDGGSSTFTGLTDTPEDYYGEGGKLVRVSAAEDALEFVDAPSHSPTTLTDLTDTPAEYSGQAGRLIAVKATEDGTEFVDAPVTGPSVLTDLTDTPAEYNGQAGKLVAVKDTEDGLHFVDGGELSVSDAIYGAGWNGVTDVAPSKNSVYDAIDAVNSTLATIGTEAIPVSLPNDAGQNGFSGFKAGSQTSGACGWLDLSRPYTSLEVVYGTQLDSGVSGTGTAAFYIDETDEKISGDFSIDGSNGHTLTLKAWDSLSMSSKKLTFATIVARITSDVTDSGTGSAPDMEDVFITAYYDAYVAGTPAPFGTTAGTICEGDDDRIPNSDEQSFLALITKSGDDYTLTLPGNGKLIIAGDVKIDGELT